MLRPMIIATVKRPATTTKSQKILWFALDLSETLKTLGNQLTAKEASFTLRNDESFSGYSRYDRTATELGQ